MGLWKLQCISLVQHVEEIIDVGGGKGVAGFLGQGNIRTNGTNSVVTAEHGLL